MAYGDTIKILGLASGVNLQEHRTYRIWKAMKGRLSNCGAYADKPISIDPRWADFLNFFEDMGHPPTDQHSLDRKDNAGGYCKSNCRWATAAQQNNNKSSTIRFRGLSLRETSNLLGIPYLRLYRRIKAGQSVSQAIQSVKGVRK